MQEVQFNGEFSTYHAVPGGQKQRLWLGFQTVPSKQKMQSWPSKLLLSGQRHTLLQGSQNWPRPQGTWQQSQAGSYTDGIGVGDGEGLMIPAMVGTTVGVGVGVGHRCWRYWSVITNTTPASGCCAATRAAKQQLARARLVRELHRGILLL